MNGIYWWQSSSHGGTTGRSVRRSIYSGEGARESISFRPINDGGSFVAQHGKTVLMCTGIAAFCAAGLVFMFLNEALMLLGGTLYLGVLAVGLLVALLYPLQLYQGYRMIKTFEPKAGEGAVEITARVRAEQPDPVVMLRYRKEGFERYISVPMSRKKGDQYSTYVAKSDILGTRDEATMTYSVDIADGGEAYDLRAITG